MRFNGFNEVISAMEEACRNKTYGEAVFFVVPEGHITGCFTRSTSPNDLPNEVKNALRVVSTYFNSPTITIECNDNKPVRSIKRVRSVELSF